MRREQSVTRTDLTAIELDKLNGGILKINPLLEWSETACCLHEEHHLPKNRLYMQGYRSFGCAPAPVRSSRVRTPGQVDGGGRTRK
jgi:phosphoadenosine phosphosulfate reductase